jgi:hypothetical protein
MDYSADIRQYGFIVREKRKNAKNDNQSLPACTGAAVQS